MSWEILKACNIWKLVGGGLAIQNFRYFEKLAIDPDWNWERFRYKSPHSKLNIGHKTSSWLRKCPKHRWTTGRISLSPSVCILILQGLWKGFLERHSEGAVGVLIQKSGVKMQFAVQATRQKLERTLLPPAKTHLDTRQRDALWILRENRGKMQERYRSITLPKLTSPTLEQGRSSGYVSSQKYQCIHSVGSYIKRKGNPYNRGVSTVVLVFLFFPAQPNWCIRRGLFPTHVWWNDPHNVWYVYLLICHTKYIKLNHSCR